MYVAPTPCPLLSKKTEALSGNFSIPGDKSISHRALILSSIADGISEIEGLLESDDVLHTLESLRCLGVFIQKKNNKWHVHGLGNGGLCESTTPLNFGNSGTGIRLCMGLVSSYNMKTTFIGDSSLSERPMDRILIPLKEMGVQVKSSNNELLPITLQGAQTSAPISYVIPVPSSQVKSAILLAALNTPGTTTVTELVQTRTHTENLLKLFKVPLKTTLLDKGACQIKVKGQTRLTAQNLRIAGDPSSAAFLIVAALITPNSCLKLNNILISTSRNGFLEVLQEMNGKIEILNKRSLSGEMIADIIVRSSSLIGVTVSQHRSASMIDEYPILSIAAAVAEGTSKFLGLEELKYKESNRLMAIANGLISCGIICKAGANDLTICGQRIIPGGGKIKTLFDHRIAMSFLILGLVSQQPILVDDISSIQTSFPNFLSIMKQSGANFA